MTIVRVLNQLAAAFWPETHPCLVCGKQDAEKPNCFRGSDWCCENHRKEIQGNPKWKPFDNTRKEDKKA